MRNLFIAAFALLSTIAGAQKLENSLLWKITGNGIKEPSYLFGTIHITCDATLSDKVKQALNNTKQLYLELDMDDPAMQTTLMSGMMMKDGETLTSLTSEDDFKIVDEFLQKHLGMSAKMFNSIKPAMISSMLIPSMLDCPMQSIEQELMKITAEQKEEVYGLEAVEDQLAMFDAIPYKQQIEELVKTAQGDMATDKDEFKKVMELYESGNINEMLAFMQQSDNKMYAEHQAIMLDNRNKNWIPVIAKAAKETPTFFGVGAAHLAGENGVINLLRKQGYKVEAVK